MTDPEYEIGLTDFQTLETGLREASVESRTDARGGAITALQSVIAFVNSVPRFEQQNLALPLTQLMAALHGLESGQTVPMLKAKPVENRRPDADFRNIAKAYGAFAVDELIRFGMRQQQACRFVAAHLQKAGVPIAGKRPAWQTVRDWRKRITKLSPDNQARLTVSALRDECMFGEKMTLETVKGRLENLLPTLLTAANAGVK